MRRATLPAYGLGMLCENTPIFSKVGQYHISYFRFQGVTWAPLGLPHPHDPAAAVDRRSWSAFVAHGVEWWE